MVTRLVGTYGLGNRPGRGDFGTGSLVFQDCFESAIRFHNPISSEDRFYCRPTLATEHMVDAITCPTAFFNSCKGMPLRLIDPAASADCAARTSTTAENQVYHVGYALADALAPGDYVVWVEVGLEGDFDENYESDFSTIHRSPPTESRSLGQSSILWRAEISAGDGAASAAADDYAGYGSLDGGDGELRRGGEVEDRLGCCAEASGRSAAELAGEVVAPALHCPRAWTAKRENAPSTRVSSRPRPTARRTTRKWWSSGASAIAS